jgi:hypothetical protein
MRAAIKKDIVAVGKRKAGCCWWKYGKGVKK